MKTGFRSRVLSGFGALVTAVLLVVPSIGAQQGGTVTGRVLDSQSGQPLAAAQVFISALDLGGLTQQNGRYLLQNVPAGTHTLTVARIGYRTTEAQVSVGGGQTVEQNFAVAEEALQLDEIIVTGTPGGTQRRAIGNTVATVSVSDIVGDVAVQSMQDLLQGRTTGLRFTIADGNVGSGAPVQLRGTGSFDIGRNQPLLYVDGVRVNNQADAGPAFADGRQVSVMDDFNPEDIESIEIIKGPAAASLYGTEASAGVIQIITKRGREGAPEFNVSIRQGLNWVMNPTDKMGPMATCPNDPSPGPTSCADRSELVEYNMYTEGTRYIREGYFPWPTENLFQNGHTQSFNADVRGGSQAISYFMSANYDEEEGFVWYNTDETFRLRANLGVVFDEHFSLDVSTGFVDGHTRFASATPGDGGIWQDLGWSNGYYLDRVNAFDAAPNCTESGCGPGVRLGGFQEHLPSDVAENEATRDYTRFTGSATLNFNTGDFGVWGGMTGSVSTRGVVGIDKGWEVNRILHRVEDGVVPDGTGCLIEITDNRACLYPQQDLTPFTSTWGSVYEETDTGELQYERPIQTNTSYDVSSTFNLEVNDTWGLATSVGAQYYVAQRDFFGSEGTGFASLLSTTINQLSATQVTTNYELLEDKSLGFYVQETVSYNDRIFVTGAVRRDDASTFGIDAEAQTYPKLSGTWVVSEESFWNVDFVNSMRVRGAWGRAGRQPSATASFNIYTAVPGPGGAPAIRPDSPGNPAVAPEVSTELELGVDFAILDDRISGEFTKYWREDKQSLLELPQLPSFGFPGDTDQNLGRIDNWGWEAMLSAQLYTSEAISVSLDVAADYTDNEIISLGEFPGTDNIRIGIPYPNNEQEDLVIDAQFDPTLPAGALTSSFGQRLSATCDPGISQAPAGAANPDQYANLPGGVPVDCQDDPGRIIFSGRGFQAYSFTIAPRVSLLGNTLQIFALAEGQYGAVHSDDVHLWGHNYNNSAVSRSEDDAAWVASNQLNGTGQTVYMSLYDADFWKLREVGARYTLPQSIVARAGASRASLAVSARGIWKIWVAQKSVFGENITDPEFGDATAFGGDGNFRGQPPGSSINVTMRVTF